VRERDRERERNRKKERERERERRYLHFGGGKIYHIEERRRSR